MELLKGNTQYVCFAPIDLKLAYIYAYDGFDVAGVTNTEEEPAAETIIALTACNEVVPVGCTVHFANDSTDTEYIVESITSAGGEAAVFTMTINGDTGTFNLTFDGDETTAIAVDAALTDVQNAINALASMEGGLGVVVTGVPGTNYIVTFQSNEEIVASRFTLSVAPTGGAATWVRTTPGAADTNTATITLTAGLAEIVEAGGAVTFTGRRLEVKIGEGNLNYTETRNLEYIKDRGLLDTVKEADEEPMEVSFDFIWDFITGVTGSVIPTLEDVLKKTGEASSWETTSPDACEPYCVDLVVKYDPGCGGSNTETIVLSQFRQVTLEHNLRDSQISCSGSCNVTKATATRGA